MSSPSPKPRGEFHGALVIRLQDHGILTSTYFNNGDPVPYPETARRQSTDLPGANPFVGKFDCIWLEKNEHHKVTLIIKKEPTDIAYELRWIDKNNNVNFEGRAALENGILFGYYS